MIPILAARVGISGDDPIRCRLSRCAARFASNRCAATTPTTRQRAWSTCSAPGNGGSNTQRTFLWQHSETHGAGLHRYHRGRSTDWSAPTTSRSPRRSICTPCGTGTIPLQFLFSGTVFVPGARGFSVQQVSWDCEDRLRPAGVGVARSDAAALSQHRLGAPRTTTPSPRWPHTSRRAECSTSRKRSPRC